MPGQVNHTGLPRWHGRPGPHGSRLPLTEHPPSRISSSCSAGGCVAVVPAEGGVLIRSSRVDDGPVLSFTHEEWTAFLAGVRNGEFDLPALEA